MSELIARGTLAGRREDADRHELAVQLAAHPLIYPFLRGLARRGPVVRVPRIGVVVSDTTLIRDVITDLDHFSKSAPGSGADLWTPVLGPGVVLNMSGDEHAQMRRSLSGLFSPGYVQQVCSDRLGPVLDAARHQLVAGHPLDVVQLAARCAGAAISDLVGMPDDPATFEDLYRRAVAITSVIRLYRRGMTTRQVASARRLQEDLTATVVLAYREGGPGTVAGRMRAMGLSEHQARQTVAALIVTGTETVASFIPRLVAIAHDSGWLNRLAQASGDAEAVINEALRVTVPSLLMLRGVTRPAAIGGVPVRPGDRILLATINGARALGPFNPDRPHPAALRQLWFGAGPHFCLGMPLAMAQIRSVLQTVVAAEQAAGPLVVTQRRPGRHRIIPSYQQLILAAQP